MRAAFITALLLFAGSATALPPDKARAKLERGEVLVKSEAVEGTKFPRTEALAVVNAPPERVWAIVSHCEHFKKHLPRTADSKELRRDGNVVVCRVETELPFPMKNLVGVTRAVHAVTPGQKWTRTWELVEGDYEFNRGLWELTPYEGDSQRTLVRYRIHVQPKIAVPQSLVTRSQTRALPDLFEKLRLASGAKPAED